MVQVRQPAKSDSLSKGLGYAGGAVAGYFSGGNPQAAMAGYQAGSQIGGMLTKDPQQSIKTSGGAMERRMSASTPKIEQHQPGEDLKALEEANYALAEQPPEVQQEYAPAIKAAMLTAKRQQQRGHGDGSSGF